MGIKVPIDCFGVLASMIH